MPIYDYQCTSCDHEIEVIQKISDMPLIDCPECSKASLQKKVSAPSFRLSGKGWYETDFKDGKKKNLATKDKAEKTPKKEAKKACCAGSSCSSNKA